MDKFLQRGRILIKKNSYAKNGLVKLTGGRNGFASRFLFLQNKSLFSFP